MPQAYNYAGMLQQLDLSPIADIGAQRQAKKATDALIQQRNAQTFLAQQKYADEKAENDAYKADVSAFLANPTPASVNALMAKYPDRAEAVKAATGQYTSEQANRNRQAAMNVLGLLSNNAPKAAVEFLKTRRQALANGGESTEVTDSLIDDIESGDPARIAAAKGKAALVLHTLTDGKADDLFKTLGFVDGGVSEREKFDEQKRHNRATESVAQGGLAVRQLNSARAAAKGSGGKGGKKGAFSGSQLDALLQ